MQHPGKKTELKVYLYEAGTTALMAENIRDPELREDAIAGLVALVDNSSLDVQTIHTMVHAIAPWEKRICGLRRRKNQPRA